MTVKQNLEVYGRLYGIDNLNNRIIEISEELNLNNFLHKKTGELSSGQKNRISLAKSLINKPKILFLDEPTASLDPDIGDFVRNYIENYKIILNDYQIDKNQEYMQLESLLQLLGFYHIDMEKKTFLIRLVFSFLLARPEGVSQYYCLK